MDRHGRSQSVTGGFPDAAVVAALAAAARNFLRDRTGGAPVIGLSGIDGSGKTSIATAVTQHLQALGVRVALVPLDPWHTPRTARFLGSDPAAHFYRNAFRWTELFDQLIEPLRSNRSVDLTAWVHPIERGPSFQQRHRIEAVDLVLLEGIFLFKREHRHRLDLGWWIDCPFDEALARARRRNQEGISDLELVREYQEIYFPAQRLHMALDQPAAWADRILSNADGIAGNLLS
jgi:uridine kinase